MIPQEEDVGICVVQITLTDVNNLAISTPYQFTITVLPEEVYMPPE